MGLKFIHCVEEDVKNIIKIVLFVGMSTGIVAILTSIPCLPVSTENEWIGYYGAIIGGILTLLGVKMSIEENRSIENKRQDNSVKPIFQIDFSQQLEPYPEPEWTYTGDYNEIIELDVKNKEDAKIVYSKFVFYNVGMGCACNVRIWVEVDGQIRQEFTDQIIVTVGKDKEFVYYAAFVLGDFNEKHDVTIRIRYKSVYEKGYGQKITAKLEHYALENIEVKTDNSD